MSGLLRGYLGMSLDGRIAGPNHELGWLEESRPRVTNTPVPSTQDVYLTYDRFTEDVGAMLMGRGTFDVVSGFDEWYYGDLPVLVATTRALPHSAPATVSATSGTIVELAEQARELAGGKDVYVDGGRTVCAALEADLLDELTTTILPTVRGPGIGLFDALARPVELECTRVATNPGGAVQLTWIPRR